MVPTQGVYKHNQLLLHQSEALAESVQVDASILGLAAADSILKPDCNTRFWPHGRAFCYFLTLASPRRVLSESQEFSRNRTA